MPHSSWEAKTSRWPQSHSIPLNIHTAQKALLLPHPSDYPMHNHVSNNPDDKPAIAQSSIGNPRCQFNPQQRALCEASSCDPRARRACRVQTRHRNGLHPLHDARHLPRERKGLGLPCLGGVRPLGLGPLIFPLHTSFCGAGGSLRIPAGRI